MSNIKKKVHQPKYGDLAKRLQHIKETYKVEPIQLDKNPPNSLNDKSKLAKWDPHPDR